MYTDIKSIQILISLLKKYEIRHLVLSAGTRHTPFVRSVESDPFFDCYSVVDERSASFFAIGLIEELNTPVAICCTSGTALSNYVSGVSEAFYANLPLLVLSADRNPYYLNQQEEQMVPQIDILKSICKKSVMLPIVKDLNDEWYCSRIINDALLELDHHGRGPVHIDIPVEKGLFDFNTVTLPETVKIDRVMPSEEDKWQEASKRLLSAKKILISYGQTSPVSQENKKIIERFAEKYGAVIMVDHLANLNCYGTVNAYSVTRTKYSKMVKDMVPDILICMNGSAVEIRGWLINCAGQYEFWNVLESGEISDPFRCLNKVFECDAYEFFNKMLDLAPESNKSNEYYTAWKSLENSIIIPDFEYSDIYTVKELIENIPRNSVLHLANSNSVRFPQHFELDSSVKVYCNRGASGIDGSMSSFIGQSYLHKGLCFLLIGDLSFFYDMNALWNKYVGNNVRIMLNNNSCGEIFYNNKNQDITTVGRHIAADHNTSAKAWVEARGFKYLKAESKEDFDKNLNEFLNIECNAPIFFEVFTDKYVNIAQMDKFVALNTEKTFKSSVKGVIKTVLGK